MSVPKPNAYIFDTDCFQVRVYNETETLDMFGQDFLEEYGHTVPNELLERYKKAFTELQKVQDELRVILKTKQKEF